MFLSKKNKGFTYIELLISLSIMAIISFIVLSAVGNARDKNYESGIKTKFASLKVQAERYYSKHNEFSGICVALENVGGFGGISGPGLLKDISSDNRIDSNKINVENGLRGQWNTVTCHAKEDAWAVELPLEESSETVSSMYCADSTGIFVQQGGVTLGVNDSSCLN